MNAPRWYIEHNSRMLRGPLCCLVGETTIPNGPLKERLTDFAEYCGRDDGYLHRVLDAVGVSAIDMIANEEVLRQNESFDPADDLPF